MQVWALMHSLLIPQELKYCCGHQCTFVKWTGNNITAIGREADINLNGVNNSIVIGYNATVNANNKAVIGSRH